MKNRGLGLSLLFLLIGLTPTIYSVGIPVLKKPQLLQDPKAVVFVCFMILFYAGPVLISSVIFMLFKNSKRSLLFGFWFALAAYVVGMFYGLLTLKPTAGYERMFLPFLSSGAAIVCFLVGWVIGKFAGHDS